jgi:hypothetical protein
VRHEKLANILALSTAVVLAGAAGCGSGEQAPPEKPRDVVTAVGTGSLDLSSDLVSGCVSGAALVKVLVDLSQVGTRCVPEVTPESVCVAAGGAVRFKVKNGCDSSRALVKITKPVFKRTLAGKSDSRDKPDLFRSCSLEVPETKKGESHVLLCDVFADAYEGFYKYGLKGEGFDLDPGVEVRPGRK